MTREQQEMALWRDSYHASHCFLAQERARDADAAVEQFRKRYPVEPAAPPAVWYDEPPFPKDANSYRCWVAGWGLNRTTVVAELYWHDDDWRIQIVGSPSQYLLAGRRVYPITKPQEPTK